MKYFVTLIVTYTDATKDKVGIYTAESEGDVLQLFYKYMSQYVNADKVATVFVTATNNVGGTYKSDVWVAPVDIEKEGE